jgi:hypothetical protein
MGSTTRSNRFWRVVSRRSRVPFQLRPGTLGEGAGHPPVHTDVAPDALKAQCQLPLILRRHRGVVLAGLPAHVQHSGPRGGGGGTRTLRR